MFAQDEQRGEFFGQSLIEDFAPFRGGRRLGFALCGGRAERFDLGLYDTRIQRAGIGYLSRLFPPFAEGGAELAQFGQA